MTTQTHETRTGIGATSERAPRLLGLSHLAFTVRDIEAARQFWADVMGLQVIFDEAHFAFLFDVEAGLAIGLADHEGRVTADFDERHIGLDHVALAVADLAALHEWEGRFTELGVIHSPITETEFGHHLNLRAPDDLPIELFVLNNAGATAVGLGPSDARVAGTHSAPTR